MSVKEAAAQWGVTIKIVCRCSNHKLFEAGTYEKTPPFSSENDGVFLRYLLISWAF